jgi:hypothetical protein
MISHENSTYELKYTSNGMPNFYKDGERVKGKELPDGLREELLETVDLEPTIVDDENKKTIPDKLCIFCQQPADSGRFLNRSVVPLCRNDYETKTLGRIAQQLRELNESPDL